MKKIWFCIFPLLIISLSCLVLTASAHAGKTDENGGHYDRETGEYHYHHGYPAHQHYDMDHDGDIDCPYDFDDQTGANSGVNSNPGSYNSGTAQLSYSDGYADGHYDGYEDGYQKAEAEFNDKLQKEIDNAKEDAYTLSFWIGLACLLVISVLVSKKHKKDLANQKVRFEAKLQEKDEKTKEIVAALHNSLVAEYGTDYLYKLVNAPQEAHLDSKHLPHGPKGHDQYTFYMAYPLDAFYSKEPKYHLKTCRYAKTMYPINALQIKRSGSCKPCSVCNPVLPDTEWAENYCKHYDFLSKYVEISLERTQD